MTSRFPRPRLQRPVSGRGQGERWGPVVADPLGVAAVALLLAAVTTCCSAGAVDASRTDDGRTLVTAERELMKTRFRIGVVIADEAAGRAAVDGAFAEVLASEERLNNWSETSEISRVNQSAGVQPIVVSDELMAVLERARHISGLTDGAFDITFASCDGLWSVRDRRVPSAAELDACLAHVDYRLLALDRGASAVFISDPETRVGIAGLAKGYRIDRAADVLDRAGIRDYVIDGGGDMRVAASSPDRPWQIKVAHPRRDGEALGTLALASGAVATSGDYQWYFERDGVRYHHIIDPAIGRPATRSVSATVLAERAVDADALATGLFVMGPEAGIALVERLPGVEALIIAPDLSLHPSSGFPTLTTTPPEAS